MNMRSEPWHFLLACLATFTCGMTVQTNNTTYICGDEAYLELPVPWKPPMNRAHYVRAAMTPPRQDGGKRSAPPRQEFEVDAPLPLYGLEADDFVRTVLDDAAPVVSEADSLGNMRLLDALCAQVGVAN